MSVSPCVIVYKQTVKMVIWKAILIIIFYLFKYSKSAASNVLFVVFDDLRPVASVYGGEALTPFIDKLAKTGVVFHNAFCQMALCAPSRNSLLTSRRPDTLRLYDFYSYWRDKAGNFTTLPQYLKQFGYDTVSIGKIFHPGESSNFTDDAPLSWSKPPWHPPSEVFKNSPVCYSNYSWHTNIVCPVRLQEQPGKKLPDIESTDEAISYLKTRKGVKQPFFLALGYHKPHIPLKFPRKYLDLYPLDKIKLPPVRTMPGGMPRVAWNPWNDLRWRDDIKALNVSFPYGTIPDDWARLIRQSYFSAVSYVDDLLGKVLESLKQNGLEDNTTVVLLGDHGWSLGEHGEWSKYSNFDYAVRIPLIVKVPKLTKGSHTKDIVELLDIFPTVVDVLGLPAIPRCGKDTIQENLCTEGRSFLPLLFGGRGEKKYALSQYPRPGMDPTRHPDSDRPKLNQIRIMGYSIRTQRHRYTLWVSWRQFVPDWFDIKGAELYDHVIDPHENINLAGRPGLENVEIRLKKLLKQHFCRHK